MSSSDSRLILILILKPGQARYLDAAMQVLHLQSKENSLELLNHTILAVITK